MIWNKNLYLNIISVIFGSFASIVNENILSPFLLFQEFQFAQLLLILETAKPTPSQPIWNPSLKQIPWLLVLFYGFLELMWVIKISSTIRSFSIVFVKVNKSFHRISRLQIVYG